MAIESKALLHRILVTTLAAAALLASCGPPAPDAALTAAFDAESARGTMMIRRVSDGREWVHAPARADSGFIPASTFKIANAAIALETGAVTGPDEFFPWDGVERQFGGWNRDHTLHTAMAASAVPVYQEVARRIGAPRMAEWLRRLDYGNADIGGGLDRFWLTGELRISAREQLDFLTRFVRAELPLSHETRAAVASMILTDSGDDWALFAKTGWAFEFRIRIGRAALAAVGALPSD
jgi:beta-lactamase class D